MHRILYKMFLHHCYRVDHDSVIYCNTCFSPIKPRHFIGTWRSAICHRNKQRSAALVPSSCNITMDKLFIYVCDHKHYIIHHVLSYSRWWSRTEVSQDSGPQSQTCSTKLPTFHIYSNSLKNYATKSTHTRSKPINASMNTQPNSPVSGSSVSPTSQAHRNCSSSTLPSQQTTNNSASPHFPKPKS